jgi:hypothetical protein
MVVVGYTQRGTARRVFHEESQCPRKSARRLAS